jgi:hypothetical protein
MCDTNKHDKPPHKPSPEPAGQSVLFDAVVYCVGVFFGTVLANIAGTLAFCTHTAMALRASMVLNAAVGVLTAVGCLIALLRGMSQKPSP